MRFSGKVYEFGDFRLDVARRLLRPEAGGRPLALPGKAFDTLLYLVEHPGELLDKARLMQAIWPDVIVEENNLSQSISLLRRVLGECPRDCRFIATVPGRGYRFVAPVRTVADDERCRMATAEPLPESRTRTAIAILPFMDLTNDPENTQLGISLADELISTLGRLRWFTVPGRTTCFRYQRENVDARQMARELEVDAVLEGSIQTLGQGVRVTARLVDGRGGHHLWSESYDGSGDNRARLRDELTIAIVDALAGYLVLKITGRRTPTHDLEAFHLYLRAIARRSEPTAHNLTARQFGRRTVDRRCTHKRLPVEPGRRPRSPRAPGPARATPRRGRPRARRRTLGRITCSRWTRGRSGIPRGAWRPRSARVSRRPSARLADCARLAEHRPPDSPALDRLAHAAGSRG